MASQIMDPVHGAIACSDLERSVIDSYPYQRLRKIKQLGYVHLVFPGAVHTRFAHGIGVMHVAGRLLDGIMRGCKADTSALAVVKEGVRLAGLLHDVGHGPLSHHFESMLTMRGGDGQREAIPYDEWASDDLKLPTEWLDSSFGREDLCHEHFSLGVIARLGKELGFDAQSVCALLDKRVKPSSVFSSALAAIARSYEGDDPRSLLTCIRALLSSELDADRIDYLLRDSMHCGVGIAAVDIDHLAGSISIARDQKDFYIEVGRSALVAIEQVLISRKQMFDQVYCHRVNGSFDYLTTLVLDHLQLPVPTTFDQFIGLTDETVEKRVADFAFSSLAKVDDVLLAARLLATRTPLRRVTDGAEVVVPQNSLELRMHELQTMFPGKLVLPIELKGFTKMPRNGVISSQVLRIASQYPGKTPSRPLGVESAVITSNLWTTPMVKLVVFESIAESARVAKLDEKLRMTPHRSGLMSHGGAA